MENIHRVVENLRAKLIRQREAVQQTETHIDALNKVKKDLEQIEILTDEPEAPKSTKK